MFLLLCEQKIKKMSKPLFSILICTVGKPDLTRSAIESILNQSCQDFEIIVTDTSGKDQIRKICESFKDKRVFFYPVPNNDPASSWDFAYAKSAGSFVLWYDDDNCLVPWALEKYKKIIDTDGPDVVSGNHVYYYGAGNRHESERNNALSILFPFTLKTSSYQAGDVISDFFNFSRRDNLSPRWHSAATLISRAICEKVKERTGNIMTPGFYGNYHFHPLFFAYAEKPIYDDRPLCVIGKFASSITQQWSNAFVNERRPQVRPFRLTGISARTYINTIAECYLYAQEAIPERLGKYKVNLERLYRTHLGELILIELPLSRHLFYWKELWLTVAGLNPKQRKSLRKKIIYGALKSFVVKIARFLRLWSLVRKTGRHFLPKNPRRKIVDLKKYNVFSILECAVKLDKIFAAEFKLNIRN